MAEMEDFNAWDPMTNDYVDGTFNTYIEGPGALMDHNLQPWASANRSKGPFKLHVSNILPGITKEGLINIFCQYGEVLSAFKHDRFPWALIEYRKHSEAVSAIHELNMKPPLFMKVQFARSDSEKQRVRMEREKATMWKTVSESLAHSEPVLEAPPRRKSGIGVGRGKLREVYIKEHFAPPIINSMPLNGAYTSDEEIVGPAPGGRFNEANEALLKDIHFSLQSSGSNRTVSKGRGYYNVSSPRPGNKRTSFINSSDMLYNSSEDSDIGDFTEVNRRTSGRYVYGDPVHLKPDVCMPCQNCGKPSHSGCARCGDFYCSDTCLKIDWPLHKRNCIPAPGIVDISSVGRSSGNQTMHQSSPMNLNASNQKTPKVPVEDNNVAGIKHNTPKTESRGNKNETLVRDLKLEGLKLSNEIPSLFEQKICPVSESDTKKNAWNEKSDSLINVDGGKCSNYGQNEAGKRNTSHNYLQNEGNARSGQNEAHRRKNDQQFGQTDGNKRNYDGSRSQNDGSRRNYDGSQSQNDANRRNYDTNRSQIDANKRNYDTNRSQIDGNKRNYNGNRNQNDGNNKKGYDGFQGKSEGSVGRNDGNRRSNDGNYGRNDVNRRSNDSNVGRNDGKKRSKSQSRNSSHRPFNEQRAALEKAYEPAEETTNSQNNSALSEEPKAVDKQQVIFNDQLAEKHSVSTEVTKVQNDIPKIEKEELKVDSFSKVKISLNVGQKQYVVQKDETYENLIENIQLIQGCKDSEIVKPEVGKICAAPYEDVWYRAEILSISPQIKVYFLDFGNEEICNADSLRCLPDKALTLPAQAIKIKLAEGTPEKYDTLPPDSEICVKPVRKEDSGVTVVVVEGEKYPSTEGKALPSPTELPSPSTLPSPTKVQLHTNTLPEDKSKLARPLFLDGSVLDLLKTGTEGAMCLYAIENMDQFTGTVVAVPLLDKYRTVSEDLFTYLSDESSETYEPEVGSLVAALLPSDGAWHRASVLSKVENGYRVALRDLGFSQKVENIKKLPEQLHKIEQFSVRCRIINYEMSRSDIWGKILKVGENVKLVFDSVSPEKITARILGDAVVCTVQMTKWEPIVEDKGLQTIKLQNNSSVILSSFSSSRTMFLKPMDKNLQESFNRILQDVAGYASTAPPMDRCPIKGEIVASKYNRDGNYYRAKVTGFKKDKIIVIYLDFGNIEEEDMSSIKELPEELKMVPPSVVKVQLKDVPDEPLNIQIAEYLSEINLKELELKVKYDNLKDGVDLFLDGTHVNAKIKSFLEPSWQKSKTTEQQEDPIFLYEHLKYVDLPVGENINMLICYAQPPNIVFGFKEGSDEMDYIMNEMEKKINDYCSTVEKNSFLPRKSEMCLAEYEGSWYRASCLEVINSEMVSVLFIDYGNTESVSFKNIRKMPIDFMQTRVAVVACTVNGLTEDDTSKQDIIQQFVNCVKKVKVLKIIEKGHYEIEIIE